MTRSALVALIALLAAPVSAQTIYKCVDASGGTTYASSKLDKNCKAIVSSPETTLPAPKHKPVASGTAASPSPSSFPKVQEETQKARDGDRRHILEQELSAEQRNLDQAKKDLAAQETAPSAGDNRERLSPYKDRVAQHERNIQAIQKEISNLR